MREIEGREGRQRTRVSDGQVHVSMEYIYVAVYYQDVGCEMMRDEALYRLQNPLFFLKTSSDWHSRLLFETKEKLCQSLESARIHIARCNILLTNSLLQPTVFRFPIFYRPFVPQQLSIQPLFYIT